MARRPTTAYVDYQQRAREFSVGGVVYPTWGENVDISGRVVAVWPAIGMVDVEWPHGTERVPVEDLQRLTSDTDHAPPLPEHNNVPGGTGTVSVPGGPEKLPHRTAVHRVAQAYVKKALYWAASDRQYKATGLECDGGQYRCPKCKEAILRPASYKRRDGQSEKLLGCPDCLFLIKRQDIIGHPDYDDGPQEPFGKLRVRATWRRRKTAKADRKLVQKIEKLFPRNEFPDDTPEDIAGYIEDAVGTEAHSRIRRLLERVEGPAAKRCKFSAGATESISDSIAVDQGPYEAELYLSKEAEFPREVTATITISLDTKKAVAEAERDILAQFDRRQAPRVSKALNALSLKALWEETAKRAMEDHEVEDTSPDTFLGSALERAALDYAYDQSYDSVDWDDEATDIVEAPVDSHLDLQVQGGTRKLKWLGNSRFQAAYTFPFRGRIEWDN